MKRYRFFFEQLVTETEMNDAFQAVEDMELDRSTELGEAGVHSGFSVSPTSPTSTSVLVSPGTGRIPSSGRRVANLAIQTIACDTDDNGDPNYSDLGVGQGRWVSFYVRSILVDSDLRTDGHGLPVYYQSSESFECFTIRGPAGPAANKDTLGRPGSIVSAILLTDIWFENGAVDIQVGDLDVSRREDYFRATINGVEVVAGNPRVAIQEVGSQLGDLSDADLPTGANDGAHKVGVGGHATQAEWQWAKSGPAAYLNAPGDNVHDVLAKIVSDLGMPQAQGVSGARLVAVDTVPPTWYGGSGLGIFGDYNGTIMGAIVAIVKDLEDAGGGGAYLIATDSYVSGSTYDLSAGSVQSSLNEVIDHLNDHVNTSGHPATAISYSGSGNWADGVPLPASSVETALDNIVTVLSQTAPGPTTAGTWKIGGSNFSGTFDGGNAVIITGSTNLYNQLQQLALAISTMVNVTGDNRLQGNFIPKTDNAHALGDATHNFSNLYSRYIRATTGNMYIRTSNGYGIDIASDQQLSMSANGSTIEMDTDHVSGIRMRNSGTLIAYLNAGGFIPGTTNSYDLGAAVLRWRMGYFQGADISGNNLAIRGGSDVDLHDNGLIVDQSSRTFETMIHCSKFSSYEFDEWEMLSNGTAAESQAAASYAFYALDTLRAGQNVSRVEARWRPTGVGTMRIRLMRRSHITGTLSQIATYTSTLAALTEGVEGVNINHNIVAGWAYFLEIYASASGNRIYSMRLEHNNPQWPL